MHYNSTTQEAVQQFGNLNIRFYNGRNICSQERDIAVETIEEAKERLSMAADIFARDKNLATPRIVIDDKSLEDDKQPIRGHIIFGLRGSNYDASWDLKLVH